MRIDRSKEYRIDDFVFKNYLNLSHEEKVMVLEWRNSEGIRKWMTNTEIIPLEKHLKFVESLVNRDDLYYWLVYKQGEPIGVADVSSVNWEEDSSETGYYLNPDYLDSGAGFEFFFYFKLFIHNQLFISKTRGLMLKENLNSYMLITYFGGKIIGTENFKGASCFLMETRKSDFDAIKDGANDIMKFAKYIRENKKDFSKLRKENTAD